MAHCYGLPTAADLLCAAESDLLAAVRAALHALARDGRLDAAGLGERDVQALCHALYADIVPAVGRRFHARLRAAL